VLSSLLSGIEDRLGAWLRLAAGAVTRRDVLLAGAIGIAYFLAARLGLALLALPEGVAVFWPASGLAAGALVLLRQRARLPVLVSVTLATVVANLLGDRNAALAIIFGLCNAGEALLFALLLGRIVGTRFRFADLRSVIWFFIAAGLSTMPAAAIAAWSIQLASVSGAAVTQIWQAWWISDAIGIIMFAPLLIAVAELWGDPLTRGELREGLALLAGLVVLAALNHWLEPALARAWLPVPFATIFPVLLWIAARCRPVFLAAGLFIVALIIVWATTRGIGLLGDPELAAGDRIHSARLSMVAIAFCGLVLVAVFREQRTVEAVLRESEAQFRAAFEGTSVGMAQLDPVAGTLVRVNDRLCEMMGYKKHELVGKPLYDFTHPDDRQADREGLEQLIAGRIEERHIEERYQRRNGSTLWGELSLSLVRDASGVPISAIAVIQDVTGRKEAQETIARANAELEARVAERTIQLEKEMGLRAEIQTALDQAQRMEALGQLTGGIAHDSNNLLTVISGNLELMQSRTRDPAVLGLARQAIDAVNAGAGLNRRLLSFSRQRKLEPVPLVLNERVHDLSPILQRLVGEQIVLSTRLEPDLWTVESDPSEIDNALINLAINARDAMQGGGSLVIATHNATIDEAEASRRPEARPGEFVALSVADTGHGMPAQVLRRSVEPFFTTKETGKGTGLGLSSVYGFARQSGGFISIESEIGAGTTVSILLPRAAGGPAASAWRPAAEAVPMGDGELILVVEDNAPLRHVTLGRLESLGYAVEEAPSGVEAAEMLKRGLPAALVFSDVVMPGGMSGYDLVQWVRANRPDVKVLLATGYSGEQATDAGAPLSVTVLAKPYDRMQLGHAVRATLDAR
jgi:PAS domain S-box-containing protein